MSFVHELNAQALKLRKKAYHAKKFVKNRVNPTESASKVTRDSAQVAPLQPVQQAVVSKDQVAKHPIFDRMPDFDQQPLPAGKSYALLTIKDWENFSNKDFVLTQSGDIVYGNRVEAPARGFELQYRNIIVTSTNISDFTLNLDTEFTLEFSNLPFFTDQQLSYDDQYGVEKFGDVFFSIRGNTTDPKRIIFTFPGFGPSTTRIPYAVSYLKNLTDEELAETLMVCFQDRYLVSGTYMLSDNAGDSLYPRVVAAIKDLAEKYQVADDNMLFFGASKGGSIALIYAQEFPKAHLLVGVPQMNLPYYMNKPFFKNNLFRSRQIQESVQPEVLLRRYIAENRKIDYFYTNNDELSNYSQVEFISSARNITKYRVDGVHGAVARKSLSTMLNIMRNFMGISDSQSIKTTSFKMFEENNYVRFQIRANAVADLPEDINWYLHSMSENNNFFQMLAPHNDLSFLLVTNEDQSFDTQYDILSSQFELVGFAPDGTVYTSETQKFEPADTKFFRNETLPSNTMISSEDGTHKYPILNDKIFNIYDYSPRLAEGSDTLDIYINLQAEPSENSVLEIKHGHNYALLDLFVLRVVNVYKPRYVNVHVATGALSRKQWFTILDAACEHVEIIQL